MTERNGGQLAARQLKAAGIDTLFGVVAGPMIEILSGAVEEGLTRAARTVRGITGLEVVRKTVKVERGLVVEYRVEMKIVFLLE